MMMLFIVIGDIKRGREFGGRVGVGRGGEIEISKFCVF